MMFREGGEVLLHELGGVHSAAVVLPEPFHGLVCWCVAWGPLHLLYVQPPADSHCCQATAGIVLAGLLASPNQCTVQPKRGGCCCVLYCRFCCALLHCSAMYCSVLYRTVL